MSLVIRIIHCYFVVYYIILGVHQLIQNPLVLAVTARLCLEEKYQHHLKIYTDGSVMEDGAAAAAFVIPEFNNLTHSYSLPAVSVFTAELLAISMALQHISAIPVTPFAIVICSDSKAALTAIKSDSQNAREDLVRDIATTTHQLITRGTEVRFQWVPAHVWLSGNEKADRAAKRGANGVESSIVTMKIGLADVYAELTKQVWNHHHTTFHSSPPRSSHRAQLRAQRQQHSAMIE